MGISVTEIQTNLHIWASRDQIQQYSPFIIVCNVANNKMADDALSGPRTNQTVVSLLDHSRPPVPKSLSRTLPVLKWGTLVFLEAEGYCKQG